MILVSLFDKAHSKKVMYMSRSASGSLSTERRDPIFKVTTHVCGWLLCRAGKSAGSCIAKGYRDYFASHHSLNEMTKLVV